MSDIIQIDGNISILTHETVKNDDDLEHSIGNSEYDTEDEAFNRVIPTNFSPISNQNSLSNQPLQFDVNSGEATSSLPLCLVFNARSVYNKCENVRELLHQLGPDLTLISETFERQGKPIKEFLKSTQFKILSYYRKNRAPGGGAAIIYNENRFIFEELHVATSCDIESVWALCTLITR